MLAIFIVLAGIFTMSTFLPGVAMIFWGCCAMSGGGGRGMGWLAIAGIVLVLMSM